jgi:hypothetical protein
VTAYCFTDRCGGGIPPFVDTAQWTGDVLAVPLRFRRNPLYMLTGEEAGVMYYRRSTP